MGGARESDKNGSRRRREPFVGRKPESFEKHRQQHKNGD